MCANYWLYLIFSQTKDDRYDGGNSTSEDDDDEDEEEDETEDTEDDPEKKQAKLDEKLKKKNEFFAKRNWRSQRHEREEFHKSKKVSYFIKNFYGMAILRYNTKLKKFLFLF